MTFQPEEREIIDAEMRTVRSLFPQRRASFPLLPYHARLARRLSRRGDDVSRSDVALFLLHWARQCDDVRLVVYQPLLKSLKGELPEGLAHAGRVVERHPPFEHWLVEALARKRPL